VRAAPFAEYALVITLAATAGVLIRPDLTGLRDRVFVWAECTLAGLACGAVFHAASGIGDRADSTGPLLLALGAAALAELLVADAMGVLLGQKSAPFRARGADIALVSSGILMAMGYAGISGKGNLGLWGPALFSVPLLAAWYSFELGNRTRRTFRQAVEALGVAPELGGLARTGHTERVVALALAVRRSLGFGDGQLDDLATAAWLHHLGSVCLDGPAAGGSLDPIKVAQAGAEMLRASRALSDAGDIVASAPGSVDIQADSERRRANWARF
jgi:hypothetical protein